MRPAFFPPAHPDIRGMPGFNRNCTCLPYCPEEVEDSATAATARPHSLPSLPRKRRAGERRRRTFPKKGGRERKAVKEMLLFERIYSPYACPKRSFPSPARHFAGERVAAGRVRGHGVGECTTFSFAEVRVVDSYPELMFFSGQVKHNIRAAPGPSSLNPRTARKVSSSRAGEEGDCPH